MASTLVGTGTSVNDEGTSDDDANVALDDDADDNDDEEVELIFNHHGDHSCTPGTETTVALASGTSCGPHVGLLMAVVSSLFFSLCSLIVRKLDSVGPLQHSMMRFSGVLLPSLCLILYPGFGRRSSPLSLHEVVVVGTRGARFTLLLRAVLGSAGLMFQFYAFQNMPLADASVLIFSSPAFVTIFARLFLAEPCGVTQIISVAVTLVGVVLIARPPFLFGSDVYGKDFGTDPPGSNLLGALSAISGTVCSANVYILLRKLKSIHYAVIMASFAAVGIFMSYVGSMIVVALKKGSLESPTFCLPCTFAERGALVLLGAFSFCGQVLLTKALQLEQAGPVSICRTTDIVFAFIWQTALLHEVPNYLSIAGAILVTISVVVVGLRKWALELDRNSTLRRRLWFLVT